jgi:hypothetical protein
MRQQVPTESLTRIGMGLLLAVGFASSAGRARARDASPQSAASASRVLSQSMTSLVRAHRIRPGWSRAKPAASLPEPPNKSQYYANRAPSMRKTTSGAAPILGLTPESGYGSPMGLIDVSITFGEATRTGSISPQLRLGLKRSPRKSDILLANSLPIAVKAGKKVTWIVWPRYRQRSRSVVISSWHACAGARHRARGSY